MSATWSINGDSARMVANTNGWPPVYVWVSEPMHGSWTGEYDDDGYPIFKIVNYAVSIDAQGVIDGEYSPEGTLAVSTGSLANVVQNRAFFLQEIGMAPADSSVVGTDWTAPVTVNPNPPTVPVIPVITPVKPPFPVVDLGPGGVVPINTTAPEEGGLKKYLPLIMIAAAALLS
jgi:hypothetical protein